MSGVSPEIEEFFAEFDRAGRVQDWAAFDALFVETFLNLDPNAVTPVPRAALIAALPRREQLFASMGVRALALTGVAEHRLDERHVLAETTWTAELVDPSGAPLMLRSTFLLREDDGWRVAVYLNHQDLAAVAAARADR